MVSKIEKWFIKYLDGYEYIMPLILVPLAIYYLLKWNNEG